jgi:predicted aldo/keto reductase-like oxidoreductase
MVSPLCLGMVTDPGTISAAFERGVNFFFLSADMHWPLYEGLRRGLADLLQRPGVRDQIVVAGVSYLTTHPFVHAPFDEIVDSVPGLGHLDVTVIGGTYGQDFIALRAEYEKHKKKGVRATGASFHERLAARFALAHRAVDLAYVRYNVPHPMAEKEVFPAVALGDRERPALFCFKSTMGYLAPERLRALGIKDKNWHPKVSDHYRFVLSHAAVSGILCSPTTIAQLDELVAQLAAGPLSQAQDDYLRLLVQLVRGEVAVDRDEGPGG